MSTNLSIDLQLWVVFHDLLLCTWGGRRRSFFYVAFRVFRYICSLLATHVVALTFWCLLAALQAYFAPLITSPKLGLGELLVGEVRELWCAYYLHNVGIKEELLFFDFWLENIDIVFQSWNFQYELKRKKEKKFNAQMFYLKVVQEKKRKKFKFEKKNIRMS